MRTAPTLGDGKVELRLPRGVAVCEITVQAIDQCVRMARESRYALCKLAVQQSYRMCALGVLEVGGLEPDVAESVAWQVWDAVHEEHHA